MTKRKMKGTGWVNFKNHPTGENGRGLCRMCGTEVGVGRRTFCSSDCVHQYRLRNDARYASGQLYKRDHGICCLCGTNTYTVRREYQKKIKEAGWWSEEGKKINKEYTDAGWAPLHYKKWWDADHIIPVVEGGGPQDWSMADDYLLQLRTLCKICHKEETRKLRKRLAEERKKKKDIKGEE